MTICSKQFSLAKEGGNELGPPRPTPDSLEGLAREVVEFPNVSGAEVGQFVLLPIAPKILDRMVRSGEIGNTLSGEMGAKPKGVSPQKLEFGSSSTFGVRALPRFTAARTRGPALHSKERASGRS